MWRAGWGERGGIITSGQAERWYFGDQQKKLNQLIAEMEGYDEINMPCFFVFFILLIFGDTILREK